MVILASRGSKARVAAGIGAAAGFVWMLYLFFAGFTIAFGSVEQEEPTMTVTCSPLVGFFQDLHFYDELDGATSYRSSYATVSGNEPPGPATDPFLAYREIDATCEQHRSARAGLIGLLAAPTAVLALISVARRPAGATGNQAARHEQELTAHAAASSESLSLRGAGDQDSGGQHDE